MAVWYDQPNRSHVEMTGDDVPQFLHNLCTNAVKDLPLGAGAEFFLCTATAKAVAFGRVYHVRIADGQHAFMLDLDPGQASATIQHLSKFIISEQVNLIDRSGELGLIHLTGSAADKVLAQASGAAVPALGSLDHMPRTMAGVAVSVRRHDPLGALGYDIVGARESMPALGEWLTACGAEHGKPETYEALRIMAGTPVWGHEIDETRFVVEVNRPAAISFAKGCFPGQEPIVMARDRTGHAPRLLVGLRLTAPASPGLALRREGKEVGKVTSATLSPHDNTPIALAYVRWGHHEAGVSLETDVGSATVCSLPMT